MPSVFVPNRGPYDYSAAERFGKLVFLTEGTVQRFAVGDLFRTIAEGMVNSSEDDYLLIYSLGILNALAASVLARRHGKINFLMYKNGEYMPRSVELDPLL
jgi:hypothetical protein